MFALLTEPSIANDGNAVKLMLYVISSLLGIIAFLIGFGAKNIYKSFKELNANFLTAQMNAMVNDKRLDNVEEDLDTQKKKMDNVTSTLAVHGERLQMLRNSG